MIVFGTDFDDTLYFHNGDGFRQKDIDAIRRFQQAGHQFGLISGRGVVMWPILSRLIEGKVDFDFRIFANGACICDRDGKILWQIFLPREAVQEIYEAARREGVPLILHGENQTYFTSTDHPHDMPGMVIRSLNEIDPDRIYEISFNNAKPAGARLFAQMKNYDKAVLISNSRFADFHPLATSKGDALLRLTKMLHETQDTSAAIGDSFNDLSMLKKADISFTFETSPEEVRQAATCVTDGVKGAVDILLGRDSVARTSSSCR